MKKIFTVIMICALAVVSQASAASMIYNNHDVFIIGDDTETIAVVNLSENQNKTVYLGGKTVGIAIYTDGLYVNDIVTIENEQGKNVSPATKAGIKKGDYIVKANGIKLNDISNIDAIVKNSKGSKVRLSIKRNGNVIETDVEPVRAKTDGQYRLGIKMRDSAAGLGTVTFIDPLNKSYAALGHSINDNDTGEMLNIRDGRIVECVVTGVKKAERHKAGELKGTFGVNAIQYGSIKNNSKFGLNGLFYETDVFEEIQLGSKYDVEEGEAFIYSDFEGNGIKKYSIEIVKVNNQTYPSEKGMVIRVTDKNLIDKTGGIVQGMSGSPIVQKDKLVGAVTHVLIDDPTRGYGIFIEYMMLNQQNINNAA